MSAEPLSRERWNNLVTRTNRSAEELIRSLDSERIEFQVAIRAETARADAAEAALARVRNALAALDGHTCHGGCTNSDHLREVRAFMAEVRAALEGGVVSEVGSISSPDDGPCVYCDGPTSAGHVCDECKWWFEAS